MEDKKAATILIKMLKKYRFNSEEKEALSEAVGILSWTSLAQSRLKNIKANRSKKNQPLP